MTKLTLLPGVFRAKRLYFHFTLFLLAFAGILLATSESRALPYGGAMAPANKAEIGVRAEQEATQNVCGTIAALIETIQSLDLNEGLEEALIVKLNHALTNFINGDYTTAINQLNAFINQVEAKRDKPLTDEEADALIAQVAALITAIENGTANCNGPEVECPPAFETFCGYTPNNSALWNQPYWWDATTGLHDLCEAITPLSTTSANSCSGSNVSISYLLFLDLDGDGVMETVVDSKNPPAPGMVNYGNAGNVNYSGGTPRLFDGRAVAAENLYRWSIHESVSGDSRTASLQWKTIAQMPATDNPFGTPGIQPQLPYGNHKIRWILADNCGGQSACEYEFVIEDCKAPTMVCMNGLSAYIGPEGTFVVYALDFLVYFEDNYTPSNLLKLGIQHSYEYPAFPQDGSGNPIYSLAFNCDELGYQIVRVWAMDLAGRADYCETYIHMQDPSNWCDSERDGSGTSLAGPLRLELFPNPANPEVNIRLQGLETQGMLSIFNPLGDAVWQQMVEPGMDGLKISLADNAFMPGVYVVSLCTGQETVIRRLVVNR